MILVVTVRLFKLFAKKIRSFRAEVRLLCVAGQLLPVCPRVTSVHTEPHVQNPPT